MISLEKVSFDYGGRPVLEEVSLEVARGDLLAILGPNGSGKTTLLKLMMGLLLPRRGRVLLNGKPPGRDRAGTSIGYVPQRNTQLDWRFPATVQEVVASGCVAASRGGLNGREIRKRVEEMLDFVQLGDCRRELISHLSGGQQQRVLIARALAGSPELLILDEPTTGLDCAAQNRFYELLGRINQDLGLTLVIVSHDIGIVSRKVTRVACINRRLIYHGAPAGALDPDHLTALYGTAVIPVWHNH